MFNSILMHMPPIAGVLAYIVGCAICGCDMRTSNHQHQDQECTARFVRFSVVIVTILLSSLRIFVGKLRRPHYEKPHICCRHSDMCRRNGICTTCLAIRI